MTSLPAYQTVNQLLYAGTRERLIDLNEVVSQVPIPSNLESRARVVLDSDYPTLTITRVSYRIAIPAMLVGAESDQLRTTDANDMALIQTDANRGMVMKSAVVTGIPEQAQANGEIIGGVTFQPGGRIYRCQATRVTGAGNKRAAVPDGVQAFVLVLAGNGDVQRGGSTFTSPAGGSLLDVGSASANITIPAGITEAWVLQGPSVEV